MSFIGTPKTDVIIGTAENEWIWIGGGDDFVFAGKGDDFIWDEPVQIIIPLPTHDDIIRGGKGDDSFSYIDGNDTFFGGKGCDTVILDTSRIADVVRDGKLIEVLMSDGDVLTLKGVELVFDC